MSTLAAPHPRTSRQPASRSDAHRVPSRLGRYTDHHSGTTREIVCQPGAAGSRLVIDRDAATLGDRHLVAHLAADEPRENDRIVTEVYLADKSRGSCRLVCAEDLELTPFASCSPGTDRKASPDTQLVDSDGIVYRIREISDDGSFPELRWTRSSGNASQDEPFEVLTLREVVARLQDYEPARTITSAALAVHRDNCCLSTCRLQAELERMTTSAIVLNRGLREAVQREVARGELSMSQIAMRCGRFKHDKRGNQSGETSWLARRIGQHRESGQTGPTPWVHTDILALIVRDGLGATPREIEL
jgi:hypothetical protein